MCQRPAVRSHSTPPYSALGACELLQEAFSDLVQRCGGSGPMTCALVLGGAGGTLLWIPGSPRIEVSGVELSGWKAPLAGAAFGLYSAQLPQGAALSDRYRQLCIWLADRCQLARGEKAAEARDSQGSCDEVARGDRFEPNGGLAPILWLEA
ncbi:unnamed protein product [Durusdinium trenchii]